MFSVWNFHLADNVDRRIASEAVEGNRDSGEQLVRRHYTSVYGFLFALTHSREAAEELTQATFIETWKSLSSFQGRSSLRTWIHRIAYRQYARWCESEVPVGAEDIERGEPSHEANVIDAVWLHGAIRMLPEDLRETFVLFYVQELSAKEVADVLGLPRGTVLSRLYAARDRLRRQLSIPSERRGDIAEGEITETGGTRYEMRKASI